MNSKPAVQSRFAHAALVSLMLAGCGGGGDEATENGSHRYAAAAAVAARAPSSVKGADAGPVLTEPSAQPRDPAERSRAGLYLSSRGATELERRLRGDVVWVHVVCCGPDQRDMAILGAFGMQASQNLGNEAPFLVRGQNPREAAVVADRLTEAGLRRVILVGG